MRAQLACSLAALVGDEFEGGVAVIVEPAHEAFRARPFHARRIEAAGDGIEEGARIVREELVDLRRVGDEALIAAVLAVEDA